MTLPTLTKSWKISANNSYKVQADLLACSRNFWFNFVTWLKSSGWQVRSASIGSGTPSTSTDWTTQSSLNWGTIQGGGYTIAHSWIVLRNPTIGPNFDMCIQLAVNDWNMNSQNQSGFTFPYGVYVAPNGYNTTGLVTTARPAATSSDEIQIVNDSRTHSVGQPQGIFTGNTALTWHGWASTTDGTTADGACTRAVFYVNDVLTGIFMIDKVQDPSNNWSNPFYAVFNAAGGNAVSIQSAWSNNTLIKTKIGSTNSVGLYASFESITGQSTMLSNQKNDISGEMPVLPIGIVSTTTPVRGHHGNMFDAWCVPATVNGALYPDSTTRTFSHHWGMLLPWNPADGLVKTR